MVVSRARFVLASLLLTAPCACGTGNDVTETAILAARQTWRNARLRDYDLEWIRRDGGVTHYLVYVREGEVRQVRSVQPDGREVVLQPDDPDAFSVEGLFRVVESDLRPGARLDPDPTLGYPGRYRGTGVGFDVVRIETRPEPGLPPIPPPAGVVPRRP